MYKVTTKIRNIEFGEVTLRQYPETPNRRYSGTMELYVICYRHYMFACPKSYFNKITRHVTEA